MQTIAKGPCDVIGAHVQLPAGTTCGVREWLSCDECGTYALEDPHAVHHCADGRTILPNLDP